MEKTNAPPPQKKKDFFFRFLKNRTQSNGFSEVFLTLIMVSKSHSFFCSMIFFFKIKTNLKFSFIRQKLDKIRGELGSVRKPLGTSKHIGYMLTSKSVYYTADL